MRILMTNDDGVGAEGLRVLARAVATWLANAPEGEEREAVIVAPQHNMSGMSAAVTDIFERPRIGYRRHVIEGAESIPTFAVDGPPALCVILGATGAFGLTPTVVLSGINAGANVGRSVLHSGTVGAILTGAQLHLSGLAVSVQWGEDVHYETAANVAVEVLAELVAAPERTLLNLNVPNCPVDQLRGVRRGRVSGADLVEDARVETPDGQLGDEGELTIRFGPASPTLGDVSDEDADEDGALVSAGYASLTALRGPSEDTDPGFHGVMRGALAAIERHLRDAR